MSKLGPEFSRRKVRLGAVGALTSRDRVSLAVLSLDKRRRDAMARLKRSRLMRWRYRTGVAEDVEISPTSLRTADPSFVDELDLGGFGLAGAVADIEEAGSPFAVTPPTEAWLQALHGFGWLRHMEAAATEGARETARLFVQDWLQLSSARQAPGWTPEVMARRIISWLTHENLLLDWAEPKDHDAIMLSLEHQVMFLRTSWHNALNGYPRLLCLIALVQADLCISGQGDRLAKSQALLGDELDRQILADGGHITRNPWINVELLLDLLPLKPCFPARERVIDPRIAAAMDRMMGMLHQLRLGDGSLARFNGMGAPEQGTLTTVMAYAAPGHVAQKMPAKGPSGYARLERGSTVVVVDAGKPGAFALSALAHAGCLSFEMSVGRIPVFVNNGAPHANHRQLRAASRATASHNTLCLNEQSSARLIRNERLEALLGSAPLSHPETVTCEVSDDENAIALVASHDGYVDKCGLRHARFLALPADGAKLAGKDRIAAADAGIRFARDVPFAIHFHLHPDVMTQPSPDGDGLDLLLSTGERWRFLATGARLSVEQSTFVAHPAGPTLSEQVVLRGMCGGSCDVDWTIERVEVPEPGGT